MKKFLSCLLAISMILSLSFGMTAVVGADTSSNEIEDSDQLTLNEYLTSLDGVSDSDTLNDLYSNFKTGVNEDGTTDTSIYDYDENQVSSDVSSLDDDDDAEYASAFDLRHVGGTVTYNEEKGKNDITGGLSYVTPVKFQNPWGTCWAFGIIAASESSILSELGLGTEEVDNNNIDLSEHHLAWFAKNHIPAEGEEGYGENYVNNQDGEGFWYMDGTSSESMAGGFAFYGTSVFATGSGVVSEDFCPYKGQNEMVMVRRNDDADKNLYPEKFLYYDSVEAWEAETDEDIKSNYWLSTYSDKDDWSLDESMRFYQNYALEDSSILPSTIPVKDDETGSIKLNEDGINAVKSELMQGRAVSVSYYADNSNPNVEVTLSTSRYINSNYAHYTWDKSYANHLVCIVGWDDDYDASNFGQEHPVKYNSSGLAMYKLKDSDQELEYAEDKNSLYYIDEDGKTHTYTLYSDEIETVKEEDGSVSVPAGNGAWIVKNSWGASSNVFPNKRDWGVDGTGYFYLSYYDTSVSSLETFDFVVTDNEQSEYDYTLVDQYDYLTTGTVSQSTAYAPVVMANVFTATEDMEIQAVSCETTTPGTTVDVGICLLEDGEDYPVGSDPVIMNDNSVTYTYGGYHRVELDKPVTVYEGQKYAVIVQESYSEHYSDGSVIDKYFICSHLGYSIDSAKYYNESDYAVGVINPGESYILTYGYNSDQMVTTDYYNFITNRNNFEPETIFYVYDNFSIKAYANPIEGTQGWKQNSNGTWEYYVDGTAQTGWQYLEWDGESNWYYFGEDGIMATGWIKPANAWYYLDASGKMATGWRYLEWKGTYSWYNFDAAGGWMNSNTWINDGGSWYYVLPSGAMVTGTYSISGKTSRFSDGGRWLGYVK